MIFQSTLPQGERHDHLLLALHVQHDFNPRSRKGSDRRFQGRKERDPISIHAPARGATEIAHTRCISEKFQSTLPQGERLPVFLRVHLSGTFQSTLPQGERPLAANPDAQDSLFQSTLPQGERRSAGVEIDGSTGFQSTLPQGERPVLPAGRSFA